MTRDQVLDVIAAAWADAAPPAAGDLAGRDDDCGEYGYVAEFFRDRTWRDVDLAALEDYPGPHYACLSFMSGAAFRHFLASYMTMALTDPLDPCVDATQFALTPPVYEAALDELARAHGSDTCSAETVGRQRRWWEQRVVGFTSTQIDAIVAFLECLRSAYGDADVAPALEWWRRTALAVGSLRHD